MAPVFRTWTYSTLYLKHTSNWCVGRCLELNVMASGAVGSPETHFLKTLAAWNGFWHGPSCKESRPLGRQQASEGLLYLATWLPSWAFKVPRLMGHTLLIVGERPLFWVPWRVVPTSCLNRTKSGAADRKQGYAWTFIQNSYSCSLP